MQLPGKRRDHHEIGEANQSNIPARQNSLLETAFQAQPPIDSGATNQNSLTVSHRDQTSLGTGLHAAATQQDEQRSEEAPGSSRREHEPQGAAAGLPPAKEQAQRSAIDKGAS